METVQRQSELRTIEQQVSLDDVIGASGLLDRVLEQPLPVSGIIRRPYHLLPNRMQLVDRMIREYRYIPKPDLDIEFGTIFYKCRVPLGGRLFLNCHFVDVQFDPPNNQRWATVGCMAEGDSPYWAAQRFGWGDVIHCVGNAEVPK